MTRFPLSTIIPHAGEKPRPHVDPLPPARGPLAPFEEALFPIGVRSGDIREDRVADSIADREHNP